MELVAGASSRRKCNNGAGGGWPTTVDAVSESPADMGVIAATLLSIQRQLGRIEERLGNLESLAGWSANVDIEPDVVAGIRPEYTQSVMRREWDATAGRWVYSPEPE